ncbi:MAG TPA: trypsin-like serine protease [Acidimicrobiales bacterium]|nr:trypsin-like serine protease [Acidimicrobiales bacterium]
MGIRRVAASVGIGVLVALAGCSPVPPAGSGTAHPPAAHAFAGLPQVGALVAGPSADGIHFCTASVVHSPRHDLLVTAAHCLSGTGSNLLFVPSYHDAVAPFGTWSVAAVYVAAGWRTRRDPQEDDAFLVVRPQQRQGRSVEVEDAVGADRLVTSSGYGHEVTVVGYPIGTGGRPITCTTRTYDQQGYPTFACDGYVAGTSGGPWIVAAGAGSKATSLGDLTGVIGGLHQGGCTPQVSHSSYFGADVLALYDRAVEGGPGDDVPAAGGDGC